MKKFVCTVCGYIHEGEAAPERCPVCKVPAEKFKEVKGEMKLAAEHEYGIYAKTVKNNPDISAEDKKYIFDQLMANFNGECAEVGMYLCMARIAHREGYPEIGLYWEKARSVLPWVAPNSQSTRHARLSLVVAFMLGSRSSPSSSANFAACSASS